MSKVQFKNAVQYSNVPTHMIPASWINSVQLPPGTSITNIRVFAPSSMLNDLKENQQFRQLSPLSRYAASIQAEPNTDENVTKIVLSNIDVPITVTCTDVTPRSQSLSLPPLAQFVPYQQNMFRPSPFNTMKPYYPYYRDPPDSQRPRYNNSKRKASRKRSKSLKKERSKEKHSSKKESHNKNSSASSTSSQSPPLKTAKPGSPLSKHATTTRPPVPPVPTIDQLQSVTLRPVQPRPKLYSLETTQTLPLPESKRATRKDSEREYERSKSPEFRSYSCHCLPPMIYCMPSYPLPCPHQSHPHKRMQRLLDICDGGQQESLAKPPPLRDVRDRQYIDDHQRRPPLRNFNTTSTTSRVPPLRKVIQPSPPPQQPLHSQGLFGNRKGIPIPKPAQQINEYPTWTRQTEKELINVGSLHTNTPQPPPLQQIRNHPLNAPKLGPKPTIQWPPRFRPGGSDKIRSPQMRDLARKRQSIDISDRKKTIGGRTSQAEGSYEIIWDYFSENGGETEEERLREIGESEEEDHWGRREQFYGEGNYEPSIPPHRNTPAHSDVRRGVLGGPKSASYYNLDSNKMPKVAVNANRNPKM